VTVAAVYGLRDEERKRRRCGCTEENQRQRQRLADSGEGAAKQWWFSGGAAATVKCSARAWVRIRESGGGEWMKKKKKI
jgi:hypothetical protein